MSQEIIFTQNIATVEQIRSQLQKCDRYFVPMLSEQVCINTYANKIFIRARRFEAWENGALIGIVAAYCNDIPNKSAFITSVSVQPRWSNFGVATELIEQCILYIKENGYDSLSLEVGCDNNCAINLYKKLGFRVVKTENKFISMELRIPKGKLMATQRDYDIEMKDTPKRQYAYNFDFDVMHPYMLRSFETFFQPGRLLELGSFKGDFTQRLLSHFDDITCVEASDIAIAEAKERLGTRVTFIHSRFEAADLPKRYENIVLTHVLEHLDDPVFILKRINTEWLTERGRLLLVCPNANAPSRQIAVKMGIISHNAAVTQAEAEHGHRCTYSLDTLERDAVAAGLKVIHRSGIFFKAFANFQWDRILNTDIVSKDYLDGCYKLGHHYPDLCASVFLVCERDI